MTTEHTDQPTREFPRINVEVPVKVSTPHDGVIKAILTRQLGMGGCMLASDEYFGVGRILTLYLDLDGKEVIIISEVLYEHPTEKGFHSGLKFLNIRFNDAETLKTHIDKNLPGDKAIL